MSLLNKERKEKLEKKERKKEKENGNSKSNLSKELVDEKEENISDLTNIKVFNGLLEGDNIFKSLNSNTQKQNNNTKNNKNEFLSDNKVIDLNYISFGDCDNFFINNLNQKKNDEERKIKKELKNKDKDKEKDKKDKSSNHSKSKKSKHSHSKKKYEHHLKDIKNNKSNNIKNIKIEKKYIEEILTNDMNKTTKTMSFNDPKEINEKNKEKNMITHEKIERKEKECKNYFKISSIKNGIALVVTGDDTVFTFLAYLLPKGAKLGESFILEIKLHDINKNAIKEIEDIQKKYV